MLIGFFCCGLFSQEVHAADPVSGVYISDAQELSVPGFFDSASWEAYVPVGTAITLKVRTGSDVTMNDAVDWSTCTTQYTILGNGNATLNDNACITQGHKYFQYYTELSTADGDVIPQIDQVNFSFSYPTVNQEIISSPYNTELITSSLLQLQWTENVLTNTDVQFQLRTSDDGVVWGSWCGPDDGVNGTCDSGTYFTDPSGGEIIDDVQRDKIDDQYVQYRAILSSSDGQNTPIVSAISLAYANVAVPVTVTNNANNIAEWSATIGANITSDGGAECSRMIEWGTESGLYTNTCDVGIGNTGSFSCNLTDLSPNTTYYYRSKVVNETAESYGDEKNFTTLSLQDITIPDPDTPKMQTRVNQGYILTTGDSEDAQDAVMQVNVILQKNNHTALFPQNTTITEQTNQNFNFQNFTLTETNVNNEQPNSRAAVQLGIPGEKLNFSQDVTMTLFVGGAFNDQELDVYYQEEGESTWNPHTTCTIENGNCTFTTDHATIYTINGSLQSTGDAPININTEVQDTLTLDCHDTAGPTGDYNVSIGTTTDPGKVTPGSPATGQSTCTVTTNDDQGYYLTLIDDNAATNTVLTHTDPHTGSIYEIQDLTQFPATTTWTTPTTKGLGFSVVTFPDTQTDNNTLDETWTNTSLCPEGNNPDTNTYAGIPDTAETISAVTQYESLSTTTNICYKVDVPASQASGQYTGSVTYTATSDASSYLN